MNEFHAFELYVRFISNCIFFVEICNNLKQFYFTSFILLFTRLILNVEHLYAIYTINNEEISLAIRTISFESNELERPAFLLRHARICISSIDTY